MKTNSLKLLLVVVFGIALAGCPAAPRPTYPEIRFTNEPKLMLGVASIEVSEEYKPSYRSPNVEHIFPVPPVKALENWAHDRLQAVGSTGRARLVIRDASVVEVELRKKTEGVAGVFTNDPTERYDAAMEATIDILDDHGLSVRNASARMIRSQSVLEGITPNEREKIWYELTQQLAQDFDKQMELQMRSHLAPYLQ
ncbi:MAG TPA: hypothetical protein VKT70_12325 [Stellaceae bacterium]|nr:hypothetical protein [Stellaceae bacterium]